MKKMVFLIIFLVVGTVCFAQRGFYAAGGTGWALNKFSLDPTDLNKQNKTNGSKFNLATDFKLYDLPLTLELGGYFMEYVGMGLSTQWNVNLAVATNLDEYAMKVKWFNPHMFLFVFGNIPVGSYVQLNIGVGPMLAFYKGSVGNYPGYPSYSLKGQSVGVAGRFSVDIMTYSGLYFSFATTAGISATKRAKLEVSYDELADGTSYAGSKAGSKLVPNFGFSKSLYIAPTLLIGYKFGYYYE
ncbi:MAG: hypothetical protein Ta2F_08220 [Termitinemataceae bacterium]|nr:MAG: hypothetical protein Ta2F_08220 [Termitinemataceae bacterium]